MKEVAAGKNAMGLRKIELVADFARKFLAGRKRLGMVSPERHVRPAGFSSDEEDDDEENEEEFEEPTMSLLCQGGLDSACLSGKSPSHKRTNEDRAEAEPAEAPTPKRMLLDVDIELPDIPLPPLQASRSPLPAVESVPCCQRKRKAAALTAEESKEGDPCCRLNSKTLVHPGPKTSRVPETPPPSPPQQSTRDLGNIIDSFGEAGGVPFSVLEPELERCTPEELHCLEERNHALIESTDRLWHIHCLRDFKNEKPEAFESWREMYLRLHEAREQRLLMLVQKIGSAHSNTGQAAKTVFLASPPKAPRDVRRRQKAFATGGPLLPEKTKIKPVLCTASKSHARVCEDNSYDGPSTSSACSVPPSATTFSSRSPRKPPVKKVAPLMAKTLNDYKHRFSW